MRQVMLQIPPGTSATVQEAAEELGASTLTRLAGADGRGEPVELLVVTVPNAAVGTLLDRAQQVGRIEASVPAAGVYAIEPPHGRPAEELVDVTPRSGYEVLLAGRQSAGSWTGFLTFAAVAGVVVWLGLYTETVYLLTGAMLIAPFAGPAMNAAIAMVSGQVGLLRHAVVRYVAGIAVTAAAGALLTVLIGPDSPPGLLTSVLTVTGVAVLLPLVAGIAGGMFLVQSEHSSLISGAAVGVLVAASLAPPAGGLGITLAIGRWDLALHAAFLIALQLTGITTTATAIFWAYGIRPTGQRYAGGRAAVLRLGLAVVAVATAAMVGTQRLTAPSLLEGSRSRNAAAIAGHTVEQRADAVLLDLEPRVAEARPFGEPRIVLEVAVERRSTAPPASDLRRSLEARIGEELGRQLPDVVSHVDVSVFEPGRSGRGG